MGWLVLTPGECLETKILLDSFTILQGIGALNCLARSGENTSSFHAYECVFTSNGKGRNGIFMLCNPMHKHILLGEGSDVVFMIKMKEE